MKKITIILVLLTMMTEAFSQIEKTWKYKAIDGEKLLNSLDSLSQANVPTIGKNILVFNFSLTPSGVMIINTPQETIIYLIELKDRNLKFYKVKRGYILNEAKKILLQDSIVIKEAVFEKDSTKKEWGAMSNDFYYYYLFRKIGYEKKSTFLHSSFVKSQKNLLYNFIFLTHKIPHQNTTEKKYKFSINY